MPVNTRIQWCDSTANQTVGCDGCELRHAGVNICYAGIITARFGRSNPGLADDFDVAEEGRPGRMVEAARWSDLRGQKRPEKPWLDDLPRLIFIGDMADNFSEAISFEFLWREVIEAVRSEKGQRHQWPWLTKRPKRMAEFSKWLLKRGIRWPSNLWAGTSVTTQATVTRVDHLLEVGDADTTLMLSVEPQWEHIDFGDRLQRLNWVIQGGQSGKKGKPFDLAWADHLRKACAAAGCPYFLKQLGMHVVEDDKRVKFENSHGGDWSEWPQRLRVRQMPIYVGRKSTRRLRQRKCN